MTVPGFPGILSFSRFFKSCGNPDLLTDLDATYIAQGNCDIVVIRFKIPDPSFLYQRRNVKLVPAKSKTPTFFVNVLTVH